MKEYLGELNGTMPAEPNHKSVQGSEFRLQAATLYRLSLRNRLKAELLTL
ncbi:hypothetical protein ACWPKS_07845 [Coraliomargarita sp. W4R72]